MGDTRKQVPVRMHEEVKDLLDIHSAALGKSRNEYVIEALLLAFSEDRRDLKFNEKLKEEIKRREKRLRQLKGGKK